MSDDLVSEILEAIAHFVERQQLVVQAVRDLDIDIEATGRWGSAIWCRQGDQRPSRPLSASASDEARSMWEAIQRARTRRAVTQQGSWGDSGEWVYFLHGKGCMLRNIATGEMIGWNCPNARAFDPYFFLEHLRWRLETEEGNLPRIREIVASSSEGLESVIQLLKRMIEAGLINPDWTLPEDTSEKAVR